PVPTSSPCVVELHTSAAVWPVVLAPVASVVAPSVMDPLLSSVTVQLSTPSWPVFFSTNFLITSPGVTSSHPVQPCFSAWHVGSAHVSGGLTSWNENPPLHEISLSNPTVQVSHSRLALSLAVAVT